MRWFLLLVVVGLAACEGPTEPCTKTKTQCDPDSHICVVTPDC